MAPLLVIAAALLLGAASFFVAARRPSLPSARRIGPYRLAEKIGEGGMGEVYRAHHELLDRWCAIKLLSGPVSERDIARFEREARLTARLDHPNTVSIHDFGRTPDGAAYYVMELLEGTTLRELCEREGPLSQRRVIHILSQLCSALGEAHAAGLVHRDIKPDNVIVCRQGGVSDVVKLLDFGLVKRVDETEDPDLLVGTPLYMSPEAIAAPQSVSPRSDLYALGAVAYYLLTGAPVFEGDTLIEICSQHLYATPERPSRALGRPIARELERIVLDCLAKNPLDRPASAGELAERLARCAETVVAVSQPAWSEVSTLSLPTQQHVLAPAA